LGDILDEILSSDASFADREVYSTRRGLILAPLLAALPVALSQTEALAGKINTFETQVTTSDAIKWSGGINGFPPRSASPVIAALAPPVGWKLIAMAVPMAGGIGMPSSVIGSSRDDRVYRPGASGCLTPGVEHKS
jgi:hypothetical protein